MWPETLCAVLLKAFATAFSALPQAGLTSSPTFAKDSAFTRRQFTVLPGTCILMASRPDNQFSFLIPISTAQRDFFSAFLYFSCFSPLRLYVLLILSSSPHWVLQDESPRILPLAGEFASAYIPSLEIRHFERPPENFFTPDTSYSNFAREKCSRLKIFFILPPSAPYKRKNRQS